MVPSWASKLANLIAWQAISNRLRMIGIESFRNISASTMQQHKFASWMWLAPIADIIDIAIYCNPEFAGLLAVLKLCWWNLHENCWPGHCLIWPGNCCATAVASWRCVLIAFAGHSGFNDQHCMTPEPFSMKCTLLHFMQNASMPSVIQRGQPAESLQICSTCRL